MARVLSPESVSDIIERYSDGEAVSHLAARYDVHYNTISRIVTGQTWATVTRGLNISRRHHESGFRKVYIRARLDQGCQSYSVIARELGVSRQAVTKMAHKLEGN